MRKHKMASMIGAGVGIAMFLVTGMLPALVYGGYAGLLLAGGILGRPVEATLLARGLVVFGMVLGVAAVASLFAVGGAAIGAAFGEAAIPIGRGIKALTSSVGSLPVVSRFDDPDPTQSDPIPAGGVEHGMGVREREETSRPVGGRS